MGSVEKSLPEVKTFQNPVLKTIKGKQDLKIGTSNLRTGELPCMAGKERLVTEVEIPETYHEGLRSVGSLSHTLRTLEELIVSSGFYSATCLFSNPV